MNKEYAVKCVEVMNAFINDDDVVIEWCRKNVTPPIWRETKIPQWDWMANEYRVKEKHTIIPGLPWRLIAPEWQFAAMDHEGSVYLYTSEPKFIRSGGIWTGNAHDGTADEWNLDIIPLNLYGVEAEFSLTPRP